MVWTITCCEFTHTLIDIPLKCLMNSVTNQMQDNNKCQSQADNHIYYVYHMQGEVEKKVKSIFDRFPEAGKEGVSLMKASHIGFLKRGIK